MNKSFLARLFKCTAAAAALCLTLSSCGSPVTGITEAITEAVTSVTTVTTTAETTTTTAEVTTTTSVSTTAAVTTTPGDGEAVTADTTGVGRGVQGVSRSGLKRQKGTGKLSQEPQKAVRRSAKAINQIVGKKYDGTKLPSDFYLYRNQLSGNMLTAYDTIYQGLLKGSRSIKISVPITAKELDLILYYIRYDRPELIWIDLTYNYFYNNYGNITEIQMDYNSLVNDIAGNTSALENSVSKVIDAMSKLPNDIERAKYAHDYLTHTIDYVENDLDQVAYSALVQKKTVCAGYSQAFTYLMQRSGIQCAVADGYAGEAHAWCKLILDGECYAMDVTWDDPEGNPPNYYYYDYFNITDRKMSSDHQLSSISSGLPTANGTKASFDNYFGGNKYGTDFGDGYDNVNGNEYDGYDNSGYNYDYDYYDYNNNNNYDYYDYNNNNNYDYYNYYDDNNNFNIGNDYYNYYDDYNNYYNDYYNDYYNYDDDYYSSYYDDYYDYNYDWNDYWNNDWSNYWNDDWYSGNDWSNYSDYYSNDYYSDDYYNDDWDDSWYYDYGDWFGEYSDDRDSSEDGWWNFLDSSWKKSDWEYDDGIWYLFDDETGCVFMYIESENLFACLDPYDDTIYVYDESCDCWYETDW